MDTLNVYDLEPRYDARKSFYGKAKVQEDTEGYNSSIARLYSYDTHVASIKNGVTAEVYGTYSSTTLRHIKEFLKQNGFKADSKQQIEADYMEAN